LLPHNLYLTKQELQQPRIVFNEKLKHEYYKSDFFGEMRQKIAPN